MNETYFRRLQEEYFITFMTEQEDTEEYVEAQGQLYQDLVQDADVSRRDASQIARHLDRGEVDEAEVKMHELLEEE